jgi:hypothetical protein
MLALYNELASGDDHPVSRGRNRNVTAYNDRERIRIMSSEKHPTVLVKHISYSSAFVLLQAIGFIAFILFGGFFFIAAAAQRGGFGLIFVVFWLCMGAYSALTFVIGVETTNDGLKVKYFLRNAKIIAWHDLRSVTIRHNRGAWCVVRYGSGVFSEVRFGVDKGLLFGDNRADQLVQIIARSAHLRETGRTFWGYPIYERRD